MRKIHSKVKDSSGFFFVFNVAHSKAHIFYLHLLNHTNWHQLANTDQYVPTLMHDVRHTARAELKWDSLSSTFVLSLFNYLVITRNVLRVLLAQRNINLKSFFMEDSE